MKIRLNKYKFKVQLKVKHLRPNFESSNYSMDIEMILILLLECMSIIHSYQDKGFFSTLEKSSAGSIELVKSEI